jgi:hypothetical protein
MQVRDIELCWYHIRLVGMQIRVKNWYAESVVFLFFVKKS